MTFEDIEKGLPNGFHDSAIRGIAVDFIQRSISIAMEIHVSVSSDANPERYRPGTLKVILPYLLFIEPPDPTYRFIPNGSAFNVDGDSVRLGQNPAVDGLLRVLPNGAAVYRFFLEEWNSFLYLAGSNVELSWDD